MLKTVNKILFVLVLFVAYLSFNDAYAFEANKQDIKSLKAELLINKSEKKAVKQIYKLLRKYKNTPLEADLKFRLAELYIRRAKSSKFFELNRESAKIVSLIPKELKKRSSRKWVNKAIDIYDSIQRKHKDFVNMDLVLFNEALACQQVNRAVKAEKLYYKLIKFHLGSPLVPDAYLAMGEINFKKKRYKAALNHFKAVRTYPNSRVYPYGLYKGAWTYYNQQNTRAALAGLEEVVKYGIFVEKNKIDSRLDLRKEALADMPLFYEEIRSPKNSLNYFQAQAGSIDFNPYYEKLINLYGVHGNHKAVEVSILNYFNKFPYAVKNIDYQYKRIANFEDKKKSSKSS